MDDLTQRYFGLAHMKIEGAPAHPDDVYIHCGCKKCDKKFRDQGLAYYAYLKKIGVDISKYESDRWFPESLKTMVE